ncbi:hypothetical protein ACLB2K_045661 [Fragaria x ananassa]
MFVGEDGVSIGTAAANAEGIVFGGGLGLLQVFEAVSRQRSLSKFLRLFCSDIMVLQPSKPPDSAGGDGVL